MGQSETMESTLKIGSRVIFDTEKVEVFKEETTSDRKEVQQYQKMVLGGINQVGVVKEVGSPLTTVSYPDGWDLPVPNKYLIVLPEIDKD